MADQKKEQKTILLPEGRIINSALFERDAFTTDDGKPGEPFYKVEIAFEKKDVLGEGKFEDDIANALEDAFGADVANEFLDGRTDRIGPLLDGDMLAKDRADRGKEGDAYKGKLVMRCKTKFNKDGVEGPGGAAVYGPDTKPITALNQSDLYNGCFGIAAVTLGTYKDYPRKGDRGVTAYFKALQKTRDGDKLTASADHSSLFKPVGGGASAAAGSEPGVRRRRAG